VELVLIFPLPTNITYNANSSYSTYYQVPILQYRTIFIACVTLKVVQLYIVRQKLSDIEHVRFFS